MINGKLSCEREHRTCERTLEAWRACVSVSFVLDVFRFFCYLLVLCTSVFRQVHEPPARSGSVGAAREALSSRVLLEPQGVQSVSRRLKRGKKYALPSAAHVAFCFCFVIFVVFLFLVFTFSQRQTHQNKSWLDYRFLSVLFVQVYDIALLTQPRCVFV